jgi:hypothetical protein
MGYGSADIAAHAAEKMKTETDFRRNEIYLAVIDIAGRTNESSKRNTDS